MALVAQIAGVRMYAVIPIPRRCVFTTVVVAASDAPKLLQLNKKLRCELSRTGERVLRLLQGEDGQLFEITEAIRRSARNVCSDDDLLVPTAS